MSITKLVVEAISYTLSYALFLIILFKIEGAKKQLYNYPPEIRERAVERNITTEAEMKATARVNKSIGLVVMLALSILIICVLNREHTFSAGFLQAYLFVNTFSFFDALVFDTIWFCHSRQWIIPGTEDISYKDYRFHWKWFFIGLFTSIPLAFVIGAIALLIGKLQ